MRKHGERVHGFNGLHPRIGRKPHDELVERGAAAHLHDETVHTQRRHRPAVDDLELVLARQSFGDAQLRRAPD